MKFASITGAAILGVAVSLGLAGYGAGGAFAQTKDTKKATTKKTTKKVVKKATKKKTARKSTTKVGTIVLTYYNAKWSQANAGKCGRQYKLYTASQKNAAKPLTKKLYATQVKLCGASYWITKRAATCRAAHKRARHTEVLRRYVKKGTYAAVCPRSAQAEIDKAAAQRKAKFKKNIKRKKPVKKETMKKKSS